MKKRVLSILLSLCMVLTLLPAVALANDLPEPQGLWTDGRTPNSDAAFSGGSGSSTDPYLLSNAADLAQLAVNVNSMTNSYNGKYLKLTTDIDLAGKYWVPIGYGDTNGYSFQGKFDGGSHVVSNMAIKRSAYTGGTKFLGFFGWVFSFASVKNLGLTGASLNVDATFGLEDAALLMGYADGRYVTIENCFAEGTITAAVPVRSIGGLVGQTYDDVNDNMTNCYFIGAINAVGGDQVGGLLGFNRYYGQQPKNCFVAAEITSSATHQYAVSEKALNCYYDSTLNSTVIGGQGTAKSTQEMQSAQMAADLGAAWGYDGHGYPYLVSFRPPALYTYNTPAAETVNGVTATVTFDKASPQAAGTLVTATVTLSGTAAETRRHIVGLASEADITGGVTAPATVTKTMTAGSAATDTFEFTFTMPCANVDDLVLTHTLAALTGTLTFSGTEKYGQTLTADTTGITNNTGTFSYQWKRGGTDGTAIGSNQSTYTLVEADINSTIACIVSSSVETGTVSASTGVIGKAASPGAPTGLNGVKPSIHGGADGKITGTTTLMQYNDNTGFTSPETCGAPETTGLAAGVYYVRLAATTTTEAGAYATVTVPAGDAATYTLTISGGGTGASGGGSYIAGALVNISAGIRSNYIFSGWTSSNGGAFASAGSAATTFTMPDGDTTLTASWTYNGGGGGGYTQPTTYDVPVENGENSVNASATVSGGTATVSVSKLDTLLGSVDTSGTVSIDAGLDKSIDTVIIPVSVIDKIADAANDSGKEVTGLSATLDSGVVEMDAKALAAVSDKAAGSTLSIHVKEIAKTSLTATQRTALAGEHADDLIVEVTIISGGVTISDYDGGKISVTLPYTLKADEIASGVCVWHLAANGTLELMKCRYDAATKTVSFITDHLSDFIVGYDYNKITPDTGTNNPFTDADADDWFFEDVMNAYHMGLMKGTSGTTFDPHGATTRGMIIEILYRLENKPTVSGACPFDDVASGKYYENAIIWAAANKIVGGYSAGKFGPEDAITREQMAAILYRYEQYKGGGFTTDAGMLLPDFPDAGKVSNWACWCTMNGIINGNSDGTLAPQGNAERCQVAAILRRFIDNQGK